MTDKKKAMITAGVIGVGGIALFLLMRGSNAPRSVEGEFIPAGQTPDYLTYNIAMPSAPGSGFQPSPIIFGDITTGGGGNSNGGCCNTCGPKNGSASAYSGGFQRAQISMPEMPAYNNTYTPPPSVANTIDKGCDIKEVDKQLASIAAMLGMSKDELIKMNLRFPDPKTELAGRQDPSRLRFRWLDPYLNRMDKPASVDGKWSESSGIRYTHDMACKCADGYQGFCGQFLTPDLFKAFS